MAKTLDVMVQDTIGAQVIMILRLQAENESLHEKIKEMELAAAKQAPAKEST